MRFELPADTQDFAATVRKAGPALAEHHASDTEVFAALDEMGALDLLAADAADPENRHVNTVVVLEELARSGLAGPFASTIWARRREPVAAFVGSPSALREGTDRLVLHGTRVAQVVTADGIVPIGATRAAAMKVATDHVWSPVSGACIEESDPAFAWRAAAAQTVGHMETCLAMAVEHAKSRVQFKRPIGNFQAVQFRLAECRWRLSGLQLLVREAAWRADRGDRRAVPVSALAWLHARTVGRVVSGHVHQVFGAVGFTRELGIVGHIGPTTVLRATVSAAAAARAVRAARLPVGVVPASTTLGGLRG